MGPVSTIKTLLHQIACFYKRFYGALDTFFEKVHSTNQSMESSYKGAECIAKRGKSFMPLYNAIFHQHTNIHFDIKFYKLALWKSYVSDS